MASQREPLIDRRTFLGAAVAGSVLLTQAGTPPPPVHASVPGTLGIPGPFPGRVVEVHHPGSVRSGRAAQEAVRIMVASGICSLVGVSDATDGWRRFFAPGDVVGIKVNPVGAPYAITSYALVHEVVAGLTSAGVKLDDIIVFDRYRKAFCAAGYPQNLPAGVRWDAVVEEHDPVQLGIDGYDPEVYREMELVSVLSDPQDDRTRRSHACLIISRRVNKMVNLPVLKDHSFAGVTLALKNMSHGLVNNVKRSHATAATTACNAFIPAIVSMPVIRSKVVLHILDGTRALFDAGPTGSASTVWPHGTLYFATDPVALDRMGWEAIDHQRRAMGLPQVAAAYARHVDAAPQASDTRRQPQHIALAGALGLGIFDRDRITHTRIDLDGRRSGAAAHSG